MKNIRILFPLLIGLTLSIAIPFLFAQTPTTSTAAATAKSPSAGTNLSPAELAKLVAPIALYPDPLVATILPASAYPLEIVEAARFVKDTNNLAKLDEQTWDKNVKEVARIPKVLDQLNDNINWTTQLGDAFVKEPKQLMEAIQTLRDKAKQTGALKSTQQQTVNVTQQAGNQVIQIEPAQPNVVYVPQYNPTVVFAGMPVAYPGYYYPPAAYYPGAAAALSFGAGVAVGAWAGNSCNWGGGTVNVNNYNNYAHYNGANINNARINNANINSARLNSANVSQWHADNNRLNTSGASAFNAQNLSDRGWGSSASKANWSQQVDNASKQFSAENKTLEARRGGTGQFSGQRFSEASGANRFSQGGFDDRFSGADRSAFDSSRGSFADRDASFRGDMSRGGFGGGGFHGFGGGGFRGGGGFGGFHGGGGFGGFHGGGRR